MADTLSDRKRPLAGPFSFSAPGKRAGQVSSTRAIPEESMAGQPGRQWLDTARQLASAGLLAFGPAAMALAASAVPPPAAAPAAASATQPAPAAVADELPRHELETLALVDPGQV